MNNPGLSESPVVMVTMNGDGPLTGYAARVWLMVESLVKRGDRVMLLRFYPAFKSQGSWRKDAVSRGAGILEIPVLPVSRYPWARLLTMYFANVFIHLYAWIKGAKLIQAEAHEAAAAVLLRKLTNTPVVVDFHGACIEEAQSRHALNGTRRSLRWLERAEYSAVSLGDACLVVSRRMVEYLKEKYGVGYVAPTFEVPISVEDAFFRTLDQSASRRLLGLPEHAPILVYCGGAQEYQCLHEMRELLVRVAQHLPNVLLLAVSRDDEKFQEVFHDMLARVIVRPALKEDVPHLLMAGDAGLLLRRDQVLNRVACPTKFAEYLACGLPVVTTPWAGHAAELVEMHNAGLVISDVNDESAASVATLLQHPPKLYERQRLQEVAATELHWRAAEATLNRCYDDVSNAV